MATIELTKENVTDVVGDAGLALVDFWASWCGPFRVVRELCVEWGRLMS